MAIKNESGLEELISSHLFDLGCLGIQSFSDCLEAYFPDEADLEKITDSLRDLLKTLYPSSFIQLVSQTIEDPGWELGWRRHFEPLWIGNDLLILAPWHDRLFYDARHIIVMDPGPAFGTGRHATTRLCLSMIKKQSELLKKPWKLLDVGTGSGILAIYGAVLGAEQVLAVDLDEEALRWAERNVQLNNVKDRIVLSSRDISLLEGKFEMIVANITFEEIVKILPELRKKTDRNSVLILSGILNRETDSMIKHLNQLDLEVVEITKEEEWVCLCATNLKYTEI